MSKFFALLLTVITVQSAQARSLHPCTPTVKAMDTQMYCRDGANYVNIKIQTWMSPNIPACSYPDNHYEVHAAKVTLETESGEVLKTTELNNGEFTYTFGVPGVGEATFKSPAHGLNYEDCVTPVYGGFSVGN